MLSMNINGGRLDIDDNNSVTVSENIAKEINDNYIQSDDKESEKPVFTIKD